MVGRQIVADFIKGIAIVLMVYGHITHIGGMQELQRQFVDIIYTFHMPLFLIISGFFTNIDSDAKSAFFKVSNRILRPYLIFISLYLLALMLIQGVGIKTNNTPPDSLLSFLDNIFIHPKGAYWFLHSLILINYCLIFSKAIADGFETCKSAYFTILLGLFALACGYGLVLPRTVFYFCLGLAIRHIAKTLPSSISVGLIFIVAIYLVEKESISIFSAAQVGWVVSILTLLYGIGHLIEKSLIVEVLAWLGRNSLSVLLFHALFVVAMKPIGFVMLRVDETGFIYSIMVVVITLVGSIVAAYMIEKMKLSKLLCGVNSTYSSFKSSN